MNTSIARGSVAENAKNKDSMDTGVLPKSRRAALAALLAAGSLLASATAFADGSNFVKVESTHSFSSTISALKTSITSNKMMVMGQINQGRVLSMTGLHLQGESFLVGSPVMGKKAFGMDPAAGVALPTRVYVWEQGGKTYIGYIKPSSILTQVSPGFAKMAGMVDQKIMMITEGAAK